MTAPLVSIITPSFNQGKFIGKTIQSVLDQDYPNVEYWVIDGGSTDGSVNIIDQYSDRLSGWLSEKDKGQADGINKGLKMASGKFVAWLNSDDLYLPGAISAAVKTFQAHPGASFVYSDVDSIDENGKIFNRMRYGNWDLEDLMQFKIIGQPAVFMHREVLEKAGYLDLSYHYILDHHLWLRLAALCPPVYASGQVWAQARIHSSAKNVAAAQAFGPEAFRLAKWIGENEAFYPENARLHRKIWAGAYRFSAFYLVEAGLNHEAAGMYRQSFKLDPANALQDWKHMLLALVGPATTALLRKPVEWLRRKKCARKEEPKHG